MNQFCPVLLPVEQICFDLKKKKRKQAHGETDIGSNCAASQCQFNQMLFPIKLQKKNQMSVSSMQFSRCHDVLAYNEEIE